MEFSSDWIYLILILGVSLFSFIKKSFEKASEDNDKPSQESTTIPKSTIPPIVFEPFGQRPRSKHERKIKKQPAESLSHTTEYKRREFIPSPIPESEPSPITSSEIGQEKRNLLAPNLSDSESIRRGIIFAEIFQPKFSQHK